jgi:hypothetical protein
MTITRMVSPRICFGGWRSVSPANGAAGFQYLGLAAPLRPGVPVELAGQRKAPPKRTVRRMVSPVRFRIWSEGREASGKGAAGLPPSLRIGSPDLPRS